MDNKLVCLVMSIVFPHFSVHASEIIYWDRHSVHGLIFEFLRSNYIDFASNPRIMVSERLDYATLIGAAWPIR